MKKMKYSFIAAGLVCSLAAHAQASNCNDPVAFGNEPDNTFPGGSQQSAIPATFFTPSAHQWSEERDVCGLDVYGRDVDWRLLERAIGRERDLECAARFENREFGRFAREERWCAERIRICE